MTVSPTASQTAQTANSLDCRRAVFVDQCRADRCRASNLPRRSPPARSRDRNPGRESAGATEYLADWSQRGGHALGGVDWQRQQQQQQLVEKDSVRSG